MECQKKRLTADEARRMSKGAKRRGGKLLVAYRCDQCKAYHLRNVQDHQGPLSRPYQRRTKYAGY